jgi:hypothetical protein
MEVMFTTHPSDGPGDYFMAIASKEEWANLLFDLERMNLQGSTTLKLIEELKGWGI